MPAAPRPAPAPRLPRGTVPALLLLVGILLRAPSLALPLGDADAEIANAAHAWAGERGASLAGHGPLLTLLLVVPLSAGLPAEAVLRVLGLAFGALAPLLLHRLVLRLGSSPRAAAFAALLAALHPVLVAHAGGPEAGEQGLALLLLLGAALGFAGRPAGTRRRALASAVLATLAWPGAWPYLCAVAIAAVRAEAGTKPRGIAAALALAALAYAVLGRPWGPPSPEGLLVLAVPMLGLGLLLPWVALGWVRLTRDPARPRALLRAWSAAALGHLVLLAAGLAGPSSPWGWGAGGPCVLWVPWFALGATEGLQGLARGWRLRLEAGGLLAALLVSLLLGLGPAQAGLLGEHLGPAGRLHALGVAARLADREAGPEGWLVLDVGAEHLAQAQSLARWTGARPSLVTPRSGGPTSPPPGWPEGGPPTLALVTLAPEPGPVTTLGGYGIFNQEAAGRVGPYAVQRVRRP